MNVPLERASRALVTLASAGCVSWWLWPAGMPAERRQPPREPPPLEVRSVVPVTPVVEPVAPVVEPPPVEPPPVVEPAPVEPPPPVRQEPAPRPPPAAAPRLPTITATARLAPPRSLTGEKAPPKRGDLSDGRLPKVQGSTVRIGFAAYRDAMLALGGGFFLYDAAAKKLLAEIDPLTGEIRSEELRDGLSDWPRDFTPYFEAALALGQKRYGARASRVVLRPPAYLDTTLVTALRRELPPLGVDVDAVVRVDLVYELRDGRLECEVVGVGLRDAGDRALELRVTLSDSIPGLSYLTSREEMQHA
jgi:hypothetical protein